MYALDSWVQGSGFTVLLPRVSSSSCARSRGEGSKFEIQGSGIMVHGSWFMVYGL
jgi:hypothetical protein